MRPIAAGNVNLAMIKEALGHRWDERHFAIRWRHRRSGGSSSFTGADGPLLHGNTTIRSSRRACSSSTGLLFLWQDLEKRNVGDIPWLAVILRAACGADPHHPEKQESAPFGAGVRLQRPITENCPFDRITGGPSCAVPPAREPCRLVLEGQAGPGSKRTTVVRLPPGVVTGLSGKCQKIAKLRR